MYVVEGLRTQGHLKMKTKILVKSKSLLNVPTMSLQYTWNVGQKVYNLEGNRVIHMTTRQERKSLSGEFRSIRRGYIYLIRVSDDLETSEPWK